MRCALCQPFVSPINGAVVVGVGGGVSGPALAARLCPLLPLLMHGLSAWTRSPSSGPFVEGQMVTLDAILEKVRLVSDNSRGIMGQEMEA